VRTEQPNELRLVILEARSLIANKQITQGILTMQSFVSKHEADPLSQVALANIFVDAGRINEAVKTLQTANKKFPSETSILFQLAAILKNPAAYEPIPPRTVGNRRRIVFGELAGKTGAGYLMSLLGLEKNTKNAKSIAAGLKNLRMGDLLEIPLDDSVERKIINEEERSKSR